MAEDECPKILITVTRFGGEAFVQEQGEKDSLTDFMAGIEATLGIPAAQQKLVLDGSVVPRGEPTASLDSLGIHDGTHVTLISIPIPTGVWTGVYKSVGSPYEYNCTFDCDRWDWHDKEIGKVHFELEWEAVRHADTQCIGYVGVEVFESEYDSSCDMICGRGARIYLKEGQHGDPPAVFRLIGLSSQFNIRFEDDAAICHFLPDNVTMVLKKE